MIRALSIFSLLKLLAAPAPVAPLAAPTVVAQTAVDFDSICRHSGTTDVPSGSPGEAIAYYQAIAKDIGFPSPASIPSQSGSLDDLLSYLGYPLQATQLQAALPSQLMDPVFMKTLGVTTGPADVLVARFFAPKISDLTQHPIVEVGWRKLVRLRPLSGSAASVHGIQSAFVLFNFFAALTAKDPFQGNTSVNTQVMLIAASPAPQRLYWVDYDAKAKLGLELDAFFDSGHVPTALAKQKYFVPCACIACHGGLQLNTTNAPPRPEWKPSVPLLNYFDTDHWLDRVQPGNDFAGLVAAVVFDPGGFEVIRQLNKEMHDQNVATQPGSIQERAAQHWLELHASNPGYVADLSKRALQPTGQSQVWSGLPDDYRALATFNQYCFRCHGSVEFDVFDKGLMLSTRSIMHARLLEGSDPRDLMPPDRNAADSAQARALLLKYLGY